MTILVLGNGVSRLAFDDQIKAWDGEIWGCNRAYLDYGTRLSRVATDSVAMLEELRAYRAGTRATFEIWGWGKVAASADREFTSPGALRSNSGQMLAMQAVEEGHEALLCGFDFGGEDIYLGDLGEKPGWRRKWGKILDHYGPEPFRFMEAT